MTDPQHVVYRHRLRVRYAETDAGRVAHHSSYAAWLEETRTEWMRSRGVTYREVEAAGTFLMISDMRLRYRRPARYDDELEISLRVVDRRRVSLVLEYDLRRVGEEEILTWAQTKLASTDVDGKVQRLPATLESL